MDEKKEFPIPPKKGIFEEEPVEEAMTEEVESEFIDTFENEDGTKAVNIAGVETDADGGFIAKLTTAEMESYAKGIMNGDEDTRSLVIGEVFEGETALADAEAEAARLSDMYKPEDGATDEELATAIEDAKADVGGMDFSDLEGEPILDQIDEAELPPIGEVL